MISPDQMIAESRKPEKQESEISISFLDQFDKKNIAFGLNK
jgi:hypothetical protein